MSEVAAEYLVMPKEAVTHQLAERCRRLERELREAREALFAAERRENDLIERMREGL
jgi:hypothetical protein